MKMLLLLLTLSFSSFAQYCNLNVETIVKSAAQSSFEGKVIDKITVKFDSYAGFHVKKYKAIVSYESGDTSIYEANVYEFEDPATACELDSLIRIK